MSIVILRWGTVKNEVCLYPVGIPHHNRAPLVIGEPKNFDRVESDSDFLNLFNIINIMFPF
jgi:hypothetical protein